MASGHFQSNVEWAGSQACLKLALLPKNGIETALLRTSQIGKKWLSYVL
jgi:hypothetical protein